MTDKPRLEISTRTEPGLVCITLTGVIDEKFEAGRLLNEVAPVTILELSGVRRITSFGVRQWSEVMKSLPSTVRSLYLVKCPPVFIDQLSMVLNFGGRSQVVSAYASYGCDVCGRETLALLDFLSDASTISAGQLPEVQCPQCEKPIPLVDDPQLYVRLVNDFGAKSIDPLAASLLDRLGLHAMKKVGRSPEATKLVHDQITLFRLSGTLDGRFRQRRLASGVEGDVVLDLAEVEGLDPVGAERWRELLTELSSANSITLVDVPDVLLPAIANGTFAVGGAGLYSYQAPFLCADCGNLETRPLRADQPLATCTRSCPRCGREALPSTDPALVEQVFARARPATAAPAVEEVIRNRHEILQRARAESGSMTPSTQSDSMARYRVIKPLTEGGMAEIFLAVHQGIAGFEKLVVLKKILRRMLEQRQVAVTLFLNEAKIVANLNHPNIVQTFEVGEHQGDLFIAMEYVHGVDLRRMLRESILKNSPLPLEQVLYIGERVAAALHHAHTAKDLSGRVLNIVHRDVSPSNVIVGFDGQVKLLDFGVASAAVGESFDGLIGKFSYMSPEQVERQPLDGRSDVFALGVVLHECLARKPLFRRAKEPDTIKAVLTAPVPPLAGVPDYVDAVIQRALARQRDDRYTDARAFQVAIEECIRRLGNMPTTEQIAQNVAKLFPDQSAAPAFDPSLYRSTSSDLPSQSPQSMRSHSTGDRQERTVGAKEHEATTVTGSGIPEIIVEEVAPVAAAAVAGGPGPSAPPARVRRGTFPDNIMEGGSGSAVSSPSESGKFGPDEKTSVSKRGDVERLAGDAIRVARQRAAEAAQLGRDRERQEEREAAGVPRTPPATSKPGIGTPPPGLSMLPPVTPPPTTPQPRPLLQTARPAALDLQSGGPLPKALVDAANATRERRSWSDYWLIAAAVAVFIVGLLLVIF